MSHGREELALLDVDRGTGLAGGVEEVGLAAEEGGDLQDVDGLGGRTAMVGQMDVGQHGAAMLLADVGEDAEALVHADAAGGGAAGAVRLVVGRFEDQRDADGVGDLDELGGAFVGVLGALDLARSRDEDERPLVADGDVSDLHVGHGQDGSEVWGVQRATALWRVQGRALDSFLVSSDEPRLMERGADEPGEQRMRREGLRFQFRVELHPDEPGVVGVFDDLGQHAVGRQAGEQQAGRFQPVAVVDVDLEAVAGGVR